MSGYAKPRLLNIEWCPDVCARAEWHQDSMFPDRGQYNCPYHFGVTHSAARIDGRDNCKHIKPKEARA